MHRVYNFSAGPAVLPEEVLREAADEMLDYQGTGMSVMEMSHRSAAFDKIIKTAEQDLRDLMGIPDNYKVLFLQGGASQQFAAVPMNLMKNGVADYIVTGQWAKKAYQETQKYGKAVKVASSEDKTFSYIPDCSDLPIDDDADYVYICENNTIYGTKYKKLPNTKGKTLVADVSSCFLSEPVDVTKYGVIYGGVQKNVGPAGVVIAIIREDLIPEKPAVENTRYRPASIPRQAHQDDQGHRQTQILCTTLRPAMASTSAARSSSGSRKWAVWKKCRSGISPRQRCCMISWTRASCSRVLSARKIVL